MYIWLFDIINNRFTQFRSALANSHSSGRDYTPVVGSTSTAGSESISFSYAVQGSTVGAESGLDPTAQP